MRQLVPRKKGPSMASHRAPYQAMKQPRQRSPFGVKASAGKPTPSHRKACDHKRSEHNRKRDSATRVVMATKQSRSNRGKSKLVGRRSRLARKLTLQELHNTLLKNGISTRATMFSHRGPTQSARPSLQHNRRSSSRLNAKCSSMHLQRLRCRLQSLGSCVAVHGSQGRRRKQHELQRRR